MVYGRFNPVHLGHAGIFGYGLTMKNSIPNSDLKIFVSTTTDKEDNPLPYSLKIEMIKDYFPAFSDYIQIEQGSTLFGTLEMLDPKYDDLILLCGSDRVVHFDSVLKKYNGTLYNFDKIEVMNMGYRATSPYSSTVMRDAVRANDFDTFCSCLPPGEHDMNKKYFDYIAACMGIYHDIQN
ncbi:cytidyltransferase [Pectobacterium phage vB_PcaM_CBB]|uniref:Cytitidyltransferase n=1 Tax=Pectobacterium phage vB_PcaM_CBB TaxID=2772511 RepID=A0A1L2CUE2_9CAUD|nr:cytidyltransferase [Pectobacterium phage vB_PcaM_CBB]AMM43638.1 cytitidyltransferase [Pectobacterium phage vB_PcaM_CBB]